MASIFDIEDNWFKRNISEMIHIKRNNTVNLRTDTNNLIADEVLIKDETTYTISALTLFDATVVNVIINQNKLFHMVAVFLRVTLPT
ncbi:Protein of unknown function [Cotesia congregata]|uniref:Uncharacterized protein n=1 Tax=Cotesia congregata TaxID=51543 RepID=A0A8J2HBB4_COTCN|nr:Protein of unknown function [Cotesia congregata]